MEIFGSVHVWIADEGIANDLLARRGAIYSDRPVIPNLPDNRTSGNYLALLGRTGMPHTSHPELLLIIEQIHGNVNANSPIRS